MDRRVYEVYPIFDVQEPVSSPILLGGGFKYVLFSPLLEEMIQFDEHIFQVA